MKQEHVSTSLLFAGLITAAVAQYFPGLMGYCVAVACVIIVATLINYWLRVKKSEQSSASSVVVDSIAVDSTVDGVVVEEVIDWKMVFANRLRETSSISISSKAHRDVLAAMLAEMAMADKMDPVQWVPRKKKTMPAKEQKPFFASTADSRTYDTCF